MQAPTHLTDAEPVAADPLEDLPDHLRLFLDDLVPCNAAACLLCDVAVAVRCRDKHIHRSRKRHMPLAATAPLQDLGSLIFCHHALHLQQQVILGRGANRPIVEDDLHASAVQFVHEQHLVGVAPREAVRRVDIDPVQPASRSKVAQLLERRACQGGAAIAVIDETLSRRKDQPIRRDPRLQGCDLAGNGVLASLLLGGDPGIDGNPKQLLHAYFLTIDLAYCGASAPTSRRQVD
jgi:hypothetical protein